MDLQNGKNLKESSSIPAPGCERANWVLLYGIVEHCLDKGGRGGGRHPNNFEKKNKIDNKT